MTVANAFYIKTFLYHYNTNFKRSMSYIVLKLRANEIIVTV